MDRHRDNQKLEDHISHHRHEIDWFEQQPTILLSIYDIDQWVTQIEPKTIRYPSPSFRHCLQDNLSIDEVPTEITPAMNKLSIPVVDIADISTAPISTIKPLTTQQVDIADISTAPIPTTDTDTVGYVKLLSKHIKSAGIYAIASVASPLVSLVLAPFLTHTLSPADYGILTILTTFISLGAGITQLGLSSAFFRAYDYDYTSIDDRRDVLATATSLLCLISILTAFGGVIWAPLIADFLFGRPSLGSIVALAVGVVFLQNLTVPAFAWMRAEGRALFFSLSSIANLSIMFIANLFLVGKLHLGITGAVIAIGSGYAGVFVCTIPIILVHAGVRIRIDIAKSMLAFGLPLVLNFVSYWLLQLSDRYLLSLFGSLAQTARYAAAYNLGSVMSVLVMGPFTLVWPTTMFAIAKRKDAAQVFRLVFRWFSMFLLLTAFGLSLIGIILLDLLFPVSYHSTASVIPTVAVSIAFYGIYYIFTIGSNVMRKTWFAAVFTSIAAIVNIIINLVLIPLYGAIGAAASTLIAYIVLALAAYSINQRIYPIPFEIGRFIVALFVGVGLYVGSSILAQSQGAYLAWGIYVGTFALYAGCLAFLGMLPSWSQDQGCCKVGNTEHPDKGKRVLS
jgi:O-antigen/teichoic acid export membrane protein